MSAGAAFALQSAVFDRLTADQELIALLGGARVYDGAPRNAKAPYVHLGAIELRDWSTGTEDGSDIRFSLRVWSRASGRAEALAIAGRIDALLHDQTMPVAGHDLVNLRRLTGQTGRAARLQGRRIELRYRAALQAHITKTKDD